MYLDGMDELLATRRLLSRQLADAVASDPLAALSVITALQRETDHHLREAVRQAALKASWSEIASELGVSKQAAHQRFKAYAQDVTAEIKREHRAMKRSRRAGDAGQAAEARTRRDQLVADLRAAAEDLKEPR
jgi:predicted DNA-binding protein YlxM (UPF0122 family)